MHLFGGQIGPEGVQKLVQKLGENEQLDYKNSTPSKEPVLVECGRNVDALNLPFSLTAHRVQADGTETLVLAASGAVPAVATHGARAPSSAAPQHTPQVAQHVAALAGLCAQSMHLPTAGTCARRSAARRRTEASSAGQMSERRPQARFAELSPS